MLNRVSTQLSTDCCGLHADAAVYPRYDSVNEPICRPHYSPPRELARDRARWTAERTADSQKRPLARSSKGIQFRIGKVTSRCPRKQATVGARCRTGCCLSRVQLAVTIYTASRGLNWEISHEPSITFGRSVRWVSCVRTNRHAMPAEGLRLL